MKSLSSSKKIMKSPRYLLSVQIVALIVLSDIFPMSSCVNLKKLFKPGNEVLLDAMKEELDQFRVDMTKSFMQAHSRRKRAQTGLVNDIDIITQSGSSEISIDPVGPFSTFTFAGNPFLIKRDGIYQLDLTTEQTSSGNLAQVKKGSWMLRKDEHVLNGFEWKHKFFLVTTTGSFSTIYTLHENSLQPVFRQSIQNKAKAVGAEFFDYRRNLYMVIINDNDMHSTTFSPIFRWAGSYMDEIHQVQTTGASSVKTFMINSKEYIAIAQSKDSTGNTQVGTVVLSMDHMDRLERVQLLWSDGAHKLQHMRTEKEHFLVIGQEAEPSIIYWFGGMDFIFWQQFDQLKGKNLVMEGLQLTSDDPILVTSADNGQLQIFSRSASATKIMTTWIQSKTFDISSVQSRASSRTSAKTFKITQMKMLYVGEDKKNVFLAVTKKVPGSHLESIQMYPVNQVTRELAVSHTKEPGDPLSQCLQTLRTSLKDSEDALKRIDQASLMVLTKNGDVSFDGEIITKKVVKPVSSKVESAEITPEIGVRAGSSEKLETAPSKLLDNIKQSNVRLEVMKSQLDHIFSKTKKPNAVLGSLKFLDHVQFNTVEATNITNLKFETINDVTWTNLDNFALKTSFAEPQEVFSQWTVNSIKADSFQTQRADSKLSTDNFMLKSCANSQTLSGVHQFNEELKIDQQVKLEPETEINGVRFSNIVLKENPSREIQGYKHAPLVKGKYDTGFVSGKNLQEWFAGVAKLSNADEQIIAGPIEIQKDIVIQMDNLMVDQVNGKQWNEFKSNVMLDGENQQVAGLFNVDALKVDNIKAKSISGISSDDLLQLGKDQHVTSHFTVDESVEIVSPLSTGTINGIQLSVAVNRNDKQVEINGPALLENFKVQDIIVPESVTIAEKDVSELKNLKKVHIYSTTDDTGVIFLKQLNVDKLSTEHIDHNSITDFTTNYWSKTGDNVASPAQLVLDDRNVFVSQGQFKTGKLNHFSFPEEFASLDGGVITLRAPLRFKHPVTISGDVTMAEGSTIEGIDMSEAQSMIVDSNFVGVVRGVKTFESPLTSVHGAHIDILNERDPSNDVVMLESNELQKIDGVLTFDKSVTADQFTVENGDVHVNGNVNGIKLENVKQTTAYKNQENNINGQLVFEKGLNVDKFSTILMNDMNISDITDNMIFLHSPDMQTIEGSIVLENGGAEFLINSIAGTINNVATLEHLSQVVRLDSSGTSVIRGTKTFLNANLNDRLMCTKFSNVHLKELEDNTLSKSKSQTITGKWSFKDAHFENLRTGEIQGISLDNIVSTDESVDISSRVDFTSKETKIEGPVSVAGRVNGVDFDETIKQDGIAINGAQNFDKVVVDGDLMWTKDHPELQGLSYLFENAVTKSGPQTITGHVTFSKGFHSLEIVTPEETWLDNVDLKQIKADAVLKNDPNVISGSNEFTKSLKIQNLVKPVAHLEAENVNGINLKSMNDDIVRQDDLFDGKGKMIQGRKTLRGGIKVKNLKVNDKISGISPSDLVLTDSDTEVEQVHFTNLNIEENIEPDSTTGTDLDFSSLLNDRVSLSKPNQDLEGVYSFKQVSVASVDECKVPLINNVKVASVLKEKNIKDLSSISGKKTFKNLEIDGGLETRVLNNHKVQDLLDNTLRVDRAEKITRPVKFESPVIINQQLEVESINDVHLKNFSARVSERIKRLEDDAASPQLLSRSLSVEASKLHQIAQERPVWLEYLRMKQDFTGLGLGAHSRVDHVQVTKSGDILVTFHRETDGQEKGLPKGCNCNSIFTLNLKEFVVRQNDKDGSLTKSIGHDNCLNVFNVVSPNKRSYMVISETISSNVTCVTEQDETTKIFQGKKEISNSKMGHVSDVGVFSEKESDFLVLAQYFDKNTASHSTVTRIMRVDSTGSLENVQNIETHGAKRVALSKVNNVWMLAIANSKSSTDESSCNADSAIYMWSTESNQFLLMRTIMTDGAFDVEFITTETSNEFYKQSFVAFAQEGNSASGEVMIFRFEQPGGNFILSQTIRSNWPVSGLRSVCMCQQRQCFLMTTVPQEGITFYENRFVEGFQEYYKAPVFGATDISGFKIDEQHLFAIATNKGPILAEAVIAGSCPN